jgi:hypothetical protein
MPARVKATPDSTDGVIWVNLERAFRMERRKSLTAIEIAGPGSLVHYSVKETPEELLH